MFEINIQTDLDPIAIYAAIVATVVLLWDIVKWIKSGPKVILNCYTGRELYGAEGLLSQFAGKTLTHIKVQNRGSKATTLNNVIVKHYKNNWDRIYKKPDHQGIIANPKITQDFPCSLAPGDEWSGGIDESSLEDEWKKQGILECEIHHSFSDHPARAVMKF